MEKDFEFAEVFDGEYYFLVKGNTQKVLNDKFSDTGFQYVNAVVYCPGSDKIKAECFYVFNVSYFFFEDEEIKTVLKKLYEEVK